jgi:hypothetical protein
MSKETRLSAKYETFFDKNNVQIKKNYQFITNEMLN